MEDNLAPFSRPSLSQERVGAGGGLSAYDLLGQTLRRKGPKEVVWGGGRAKKNAIQPRVHFSLVLWDVVQEHQRVVSHLLYPCVSKSLADDLGRGVMPNLLARWLLFPWPRAVPEKG